MFSTVCHQSKSTFHYNVTTIFSVGQKSVRNELVVIWRCARSCFLSLTWTVMFKYGPCTVTTLSQCILRSFSCHSFASTLCSAQTSRGRKGFVYGYHELHRPSPNGMTKRAIICPELHLVIYEASALYEILLK